MERLAAACKSNVMGSSDLPLVFKGIYTHVHTFTQTHRHIVKNRIIFLRYRVFVFVFLIMCICLPENLYSLKIGAILN